MSDQNKNAYPDFVSVAEAVPDVILEIRYYSSFNFVGERIDGYEEPAALLSREAAKALQNVSAELMKKGYRLKLFDAYRPVQAVEHFVRWAKDPEDIRMKEYFYPDLNKEDLIPQGYISPRSSHSRGSTVDLTLFDMKAGRDADLGSPFDLFSPLSHPDCELIGTTQKALRTLLRETMTANGFMPIKEEWWHFTLQDEPYPDTYFTFPVRSPGQKGKSI
ncbi:MAG: M15 family metallopeptidase [Solobacterium sp.]|nr:M15 family metallopeptidase [Solobacterium sp.]